MTQLAQNRCTLAGKYYDQAGNLLKTVPPEGVHPNRDAQWLEDVKQARTAGTTKVPDHTLITQYRYNTLNQVITQQSPDAGVIGFWYDRLGRLVVSQNAKQKAASTTENNRLYSYTLYDALGRITEVGQIKNATTTAMAAGITTWNVYGKITEILRTATTANPVSNIQYTYDAAGNRISKRVVKSTDSVEYTWYVRDAQGNILSTYASGNNDVNSGQLTQTEVYLYGSSRLAVYNLKWNVQSSVNTSQLYMFERGDKAFELTNHLGNVLATISDRKFGVTSAGSSLISYYDPHIVTAQDYYPFGMLSRVALPNNNKSYRFGFNGKENDNEVKGMGRQQDYGERIYDPATGRFLSVDPLARDFPWNSSYAFAENKPTWGTDLDGAELIVGTTGTWLGATTFSNSSTITTLALENAALTTSSTSTMSATSSALSSFRVGPGGSGNWMSIGQSTPWTSWSGPWLAPYQPQLKNPNTNETPQESPQQAPQKNPQPQSNPQRQFDPYQKPEKEDDGNDGVYVYETGSSRKVNAQIVDKSAQELPYFGIIQNAVVASSGVTGRYSPNSPRALNLPKYRGIIGKTDPVTALGIESALIALNTYGKNFEKTVLKNIHSSSDVQKSTRIDNFKFSLKDRDVMKLGIKWLEKHYGRNRKSKFLHSENKKGKKNN